MCNDCVDVDVEKMRQNMIEAGEDPDGPMERITIVHKGNKNVETK